MARKLGTVIGGAICSVFGLAVGVAVIDECFTGQKVGATATQLASLKDASTEKDNLIGSAIFSICAAASGAYYLRKGLKPG